MSVPDLFRTFWHRHWWAPGAVLVVLLLVAGARPVPAAQQPNAWPACDLRTTERIVAVGDVHGAYDGLVGILRTAGIIDGRARWSGGRAILVQTGDVVDRGPDSRKALDLLRRLEARGHAGRRPRLPAARQP